MNKIRFQLSMVVNNNVRILMDEITCLEDLAKVKVIRKRLIDNCYRGYKLKCEDRLALINLLSDIEHRSAIDLLLDIGRADVDIKNLTGFAHSVEESEMKQALLILSTKAKSNSRVVNILSDAISSYSINVPARMSVLESISTEADIPRLLALAHRMISCNALEQRTFFPQIIKLIDKVWDKR